MSAIHDSDLLRFGKPRRHAAEDRHVREALDDLEGLLEDLRELQDLEARYDRPPVARIPNVESEQLWMLRIRSRMRKIRETWGIR